MDRNPVVVVVLVVVVILLAASLGFYFATITVSSARPTLTSTTTQTVFSSTTVSNSSSPYVLTLVITTGSIFNSTVGDQPAYFVLGTSGLESSANLSLPAHHLIKLVIVNYDDGPANLTNSLYASVSGAQNNVMTIISNDNVNASQGASGIQVKGGETVSSVPADDISHTFTIPQLNLNVPIPPSSVVTVYFTLNQTGAFTWLCFTVCGSGPDGTQGAMVTPGWMTGIVSVG